MKIPAYIQAQLPAAGKEPTPAEAAMAAKVGDLELNDKYMRAYEKPGVNWVSASAVREMRELVQKQLDEQAPLDQTLELQRSTLDAASAPVHGTVGQLVAKISQPLLEAYPSQGLAVQLLDAGRKATLGPEHAMFLVGQELAQSTSEDEAAVTMANLAFRAIQKGSLTVPDIKIMAWKGARKVHTPANQVPILQKAVGALAWDWNGQLGVTDEQHTAAGQAVEKLVAEDDESLSDQSWRLIHKLENALDSIPDA